MKNPKWKIALATLGVASTAFAASPKLICTAREEGGDDVLSRNEGRKIVFPRIKVGGQDTCFIDMLNGQP